MPPNAATSSNPAIDTPLMLPQTNSPRETYHVDFGHLELKGPSECLNSKDLKEWFWENHKDKLLASMTIEYEQSEFEACTENLQLANASLKEANKRVVAASALQLQHFACMSHEIRTPLNCIIGLLNLLQDTKLSPMQDESVRMIVNSGDLLLTVVNDVLDYSKLESGKVEVEIERSNLQEALTSIVHSIDAGAQSQQLQVKTFFDARLPEFVATDSHRLQQVMYNLLGNAIKFGKDGGMVELHVLLCCAGDETETHQVIRFVVKDYGRGIEKKDFERIFQPFQQSSIETERLYGGTGLGLAITAKLVNALGGTISVDSEPGQWSEFTVDLPFTEFEAPVHSISHTLQHATVFLIHKETESLCQVKEVFQSYMVDFIHFKTIDEMDETITEVGFLSSGRSYICLADEDLYCQESFDLLCNLSTSILLTFGPNYSVMEATGHYRSLLQVLPSVLFQSMAAYLGSKTNVGRGLARSISTSSTRSINVIPFKELRVLIAEDNKINQKVLLRMLTRLGIERVDIVDNGRKAVDHESSQAYDVVLMDMQMPEMDGIEACRLISGRQGGHMKAKVVFVTAQVSSSFESECARAGSVGFLAKPFNIRDIEKCFQKLARMLTF